MNDQFEIAKNERDEERYRLYRCAIRNALDEQEIAERHLQKTSKRIEELKSMTIDDFMSERRTNGSGFGSATR